MATVADVDLRGWTVQSSSPIRTGLYPSSVRPSSFDVPFGANRTSGVAPFGIVLAGGFDYSTPSSKPFHHHHYSWDFGEVTGNTWAANGKSKDTDTGPVVAHVFENPGTYTVTCTVRDSSTGSTLRTETETITVTDPDVVFSGANTVVVNKVGDSDFTGAPSGATQVNSDDVQAVMTSHYASGKRILFKRGSTWTVSANVSLPSNQTGIYIGAYGTGTSPDARGIFANDPIFVTTAITDNVFPLDRQQDVRIVNITATNASTTGGLAGSGNTNIRNNLILRCKHTGGSTAFGWSYWRANDDEYQTGNIVADCHATDFEQHGFFGNGEYSAMVGNYFHNSNSTHVSRHQQWYVSCSKHNDLAGSSLTSATGRHAIKMHGPKEHLVGDFATVGAGGLRNRTDFAVLADNVIGNCGPWPLAAAPQDAGSDERLTDILIEKNVLIMEYGTASSRLLSIPIRCGADYVTVRNNVIDGSGGENDFRGVQVLQNGVEPAHTGNEVLCNTIYANHAITNGARGVSVGSGMDLTVVRNNLVSYPNVSTVFVSLVDDNGTNTTQSNNSRIDDPLYTDPTNVTPLSRDFTLQVGSTAIDAGTSVPVYDDFNDTPRTGTFELGAYNY